MTSGNYRFGFWSLYPENHKNWSYSHSRLKCAHWSSCRGGEKTRQFHSLPGADPTEITETARGTDVVGRAHDVLTTLLALGTDTRAQKFPTISAHLNSVVQSFKNVHPHF